MLNAWLLRLRETSRLGSRCAESSTVDVYVYLGDFAGAEWTPISTHIQEATRGPWAGRRPTYEESGPFSTLGLLDISSGRLV